MLARRHLLISAALVAAVALVLFRLGSSRYGGDPPSQEAAVASIPIGTVLQSINDGKKVVFVDAREGQEYAEGHIPGAIDLPLRRIDEGARDAIGSADLVIAYCIKDFRGYEVARRLRDVGVANAHIMQPYGINGWKDAGLPLATDDPASEGQALERLGFCAKHPEQCAGGKS
jgi:rhodanese-related sulfurtransferase